MKPLISLIGALLVVAAVVVVFESADAREATAFAIQDCVTATAALEGYSGSPYTADAWEIFAPSCM